jgi:hypothetical protein
MSSKSSERVALFHPAAISKIFLRKEFLAGESRRATFLMPRRTDVSSYDY